MSKALNSPTARLLRNSRLFSLPPPLPASSATLTASGVLRASDTATLPYPTHQAISTPRSSRHRGDWGLKRPLPDRTIPKSNAHLRVYAIDNLNHITEFSSAADHTQTVQKWQDLNMPMTMPQKRDAIIKTHRATPISAFEDAVDNTAFASSYIPSPASSLPSASSSTSPPPLLPSAVRHAYDADNTSISPERAVQIRDLKADLSLQRWKTDGPWVNGLTEDEFQQYMTNTVRKNKSDFLDFLARVKIQQKKMHLMQTMRDEGLLSGRDPKAVQVELQKQSQLGEHELADWVKTLRDEDSGLSSELSTLIRQYFDLPRFPTLRGPNKSESDFSRSMSVHEDTSFENPPATHPSAGLSYLRTNAYMDNHPVYGPQLSHEPVQARVIRPRSVVGIKSDLRANLGIAGFVTEESGHASFNPGRKPRENLSAEQQYIYDLNQLDVDTYGGGKVWVHVTKAHVDEKGHVQLTVERANEGAVGVKTGNPIEAPENPAIALNYGRMTDRLDSHIPPAGTRGNANYGRALPDERPQRSSVQGFGEEELGQARRRNQNANDGLDTIRELASMHYGNRGS